MGSLGGFEILIIIVVPIALFFIFRGLLLWYWGIAKIITLLEENNKLLKEQNEYSIPKTESQLSEEEIKTKAQKDEGSDFKEKW